MPQVLNKLSEALMAGAEQADRLQCSPTYAAPEVLQAFANKRNLAAQPSQDIWALGAIVYEALTDTKIIPPFTAIHDMVALAEGSVLYPWELTPRHPRFELSKVRA